MTIVRLFSKRVSNQLKHTFIDKRNCLQRFDFNIETKEGTSSSLIYYFEMHCNKYYKGGEIAVSRTRFIIQIKMEYGTIKCCSAKFNFNLGINTILAWKKIVKQIDFNVVFFSMRQSYKIKFVLKIDPIVIYSLTVHYLNKDDIITVV